jgi:hypothetical protein
MVENPPLDWSSRKWKILLRTGVAGGGESSPGLE